MINALFGNFSILFRYIPTNSGAIFRWSTKIGFDDYIEKVVVVFTTKFLRPYFVSCAKKLPLHDISPPNTLTTLVKKTYTILEIKLDKDYNNSFDEGM